jgi:2-keto-3-deoxy-L-rhamnonate aldolase RhmA
MTGRLSSAQLSFTAMPNLPADFLRNSLASNCPLFFMAIRSCTTIEVVHLAASTGHDAIYIDMQHGAHSLGTATQLCQAARGLNLPALVRTPSVNPSLISALLDNGAAGIMIPDIDSASSAMSAMSAALYPPMGNRSYGGQRGFEIEKTPFMAMMIESQRGVENSKAIATVAGVDALFIGINDLAASYGETAAGEATAKAISQVIASGRAAHCPVILGGLRDVKAAKSASENGAANCFVIGSDIGYMLESAGRQRTAFGQVFEPNE